MSLTHFLRRTVGAGIRRTRRWRQSGADQAAAARAHRALLRFDPWCLDFVRVDGNQVTISGWALPPDGNHAVVAFSANGQPFGQIEYPTLRADLGQLYWYLPYARSSGFHCTTRLSPAPVAGQPVA